MAITKLGIYNNALIKVGESVLDLITDDRESRYSLDSVYDLGAVDYCLEVTKPKFATKTVELTGVATATNITLAFTHTLPSDFVTVGALYSDAELDQPVARYVQEGSTILCDYATVYLRYTHNTVVEANFSPGFARVLTSYLAREIAYKYDPQRYESIDASLQAIVEQVITSEGEKEPQSRPAAEGTTLTTEVRILYNGALTILGAEKLPSGNTDHINRVRLDTAMESGAVQSVMEDTEWKFGLNSVKISYDPSVEPAWGYPYAFAKPTDVSRIAGVFIDDRFRVPLKNYVDEGDYFYSDYNEVYLKYVDIDYVSTPAVWPAYFSRLVSAQLAKDVSMAVAPHFGEYATEVYNDRKDSAMSNDAMQSPPQRIGQGNWTASRYNGNYGRGRP